MAGTLRRYRPADCAACVAVTEAAFGFAERVAPPTLAGFLAEFYFRTAFPASSHARVLVADGAVRGYLLGRIGNAPRLASTLVIAGHVARFLVLRGVGLGTKLAWLRLAAAHAAADRPVAFGSEITLLALDPALQGRGGGRLLVEDFLTRCRAAGESELFLETDVTSNVAFYRRLGFETVGTFRSDLQARFSGGSGETFVLRKRLGSPSQPAPPVAASRHAAG